MAAAPTNTEVDKRFPRSNDSCSYQHYICQPGLGAFHIILYVPKHYIYYELYLFNFYLTI